MADNALKQRNTADNILKEAIRELTRYKDSANPSIRLLENKLKKLNDAKDDLLTCHFVYAEKSAKDLEAEEMTQWITARIDPAIDLADEVFLIIDDHHQTVRTNQEADQTTLDAAEVDTRKKNELLLFEKQSKTTENLIRSRVDEMSAIVEDESRSSESDKRIVKQFLSEIQGLMDAQTKSWSEMKKGYVLDNAKLTEIFEKEEELNALVSTKGSHGFAFSEEKNHDESASSTKKDGSPSNASSSIHLQKMEPPSFNGDIRTFAKFKAEFKTIVEPKYPDLSHQAYILKNNCLKGDAKKIVENINDIEKIWERLHTKYGNYHEIVNTIVKELNSVSLHKNADQGLVNLVDILEKGVQDLDIIGAKKEITNAYTVNILEKKLPKHVYAKWYEKEGDSGTDSGETRFEKLLNFLIGERKFTETLLQLKQGDKEEKPKEEDERKRRNFQRSGGTRGGNQRNFNNQCLIHPDATHHLTRKCETFLAKTPQERGEIVKNAGGCKLCLSVSHIGSPCPFESKWGVCGINQCTKHHSRFLHGCTIPEIACHASITISRNHVIQIVNTTTGNVLTFWDNGSSIGLISSNCARRMKLTGVPVTYNLITVGGVVTEQQTTLYEVALIDRRGKEYIVQVYEIEDICGEIQAVNVEGTLHFFPSLKAMDVNRAAGKVEMLIGMDNAGLHPKMSAEKEGLVLYSSRFGTGKILGGSHKDIVAADSISGAARAIATARVCNVRVRRGVDVGVDFFSAEQFGVQIPKQCRRCKGCKECRFQVSELSRREQQELQIIRQNLYLDPVKKQWITTYPYKRDPSVLEDNRHQAIQLLEKKEKKHLKNKVMMNTFGAQYQDLFDREILTEITKEADKAYNGPKFYVTTHEVYKEGSSSTPIRLVFNPSLKYKGVSLNDVLMKGPNSLNDLFGIQLRFRQHLFAMVADIRKFYQSVRTTEKEKHLRRVVWRDYNSEEEPKVYGPETVMFGDVCAAAITAEAVRETVKIYRHLHEPSAEMLLRDLYVDDLGTGVDDPSLIKIVKVKVPEILKQGGFSIKGFVCSFDDNPETLALLGTGELGRVLGIYWDPTTDEFAVIAKINISKKVKGAHSEPDMKIEDIPRLLQLLLTRRIILSIVMSCYDPMGLLSPITIRLKIELRILYKQELNLGWDDPIPEEKKADWVKLIQLLKATEEVRFPRCIKPSNAVGKPELIMFNDGSKEAMCAVAYVRWLLSTGEYECRLWTAKTRVTPLKSTSIPRIEMQSAVMSARLSKAIIEHSEMEFSNKYYILDSTCTLALLNNDSLALKDYMSYKVAECHETVDPKRWFHTKSKNNIADLATRNTAVIADVVKGSPWQIAPDWLRLRVEEWPVTQDTSGAAIPQEEMMNPNIAAAVLCPMSSVFNLERFKHRSYDFLICVMARVKRALNQKSFKVCLHKNTVTDLENSEKMLIKMSMNLTEVDLKKGLLKSLRPRTDVDGVIVMEGRALEQFRLHYGADRFPILTENDILSYLWMRKVHEENHTGITTTVAKSRRKFWIVRARNLAKKVTRACYECRLIDKKLAEQQMAPLPNSRLCPSPTFYIVSMDLFGPIYIIDTVKQRTTKKCWGVIFSCTVVRALYIDLTEDYSTDAILQTIRRFVSIRGCPSEIQSDQGSQLIAAAKDIAELVKEWDWGPVHDWATSNKIKWTLAPAEGQHQNGLSESLIRSVKRTMKHKITCHTCTFSQLQMVFFEIANIINSRPIGVTSGSDPRHPDPITPNDLILGRATNEVPQGPFNSEKRITRRFRFLQSMVTDWWHEWYQVVLPSLVPSYKWLQRHRNVCIGDICLIRYGKDKRASYRLGRVTDVSKGTDGLVRKVKLEYKLPEEKEFRSVDRPIHGIAVIVPIEEQLNPHAEEFQPREK